MDVRHEWIQELVKAEELIENSGLTSYELTDPDRLLISASLEFLIQLRKGFQDQIQVFNELRPQTKSRIKIYGVAKTPADFMLFRNGIKLIFTLKRPGVISIRFHFLNPTLPTVASMNLIEPTMMHPHSGSSQLQSEETLLEMKWGPFNEAIWNYQNQPFNIIYLIKYYLTQFIQDSTSLDSNE